MPIQIITFPKKNIMSSIIDIIQGTMKGCEQKNTVFERDVKQLGFRKAILKYIVKEFTNHIITYMVANIAESDRKKIEFNFKSKIKVYFPYTREKEIYGNRKILKMYISKVNKFLSNMDDVNIILKNVSKLLCRLIGKINNTKISNINYGVTNYPFISFKIQLNYKENEDELFIKEVNELIEERDEDEIDVFIKGVQEYNKERDDKDYIDLVEIMKEIKEEY